MTRFHMLAAAAGIAACSVSTGFAAEAVLPTADSVFTKWGEAEGWTVYVDETRKSCLIERIDDAGNVVQMGLTQDHDFGYVGVFTQADLGFDSGKEKVILSLDGNLYEGEIQRKTKNLSDGYKGGYVLSQNAQFIEDLQKKYEMTVNPEHQNSFTVSLAGSLKAIEAARDCTKEQMS